LLHTQRNIESGEIDNRKNLANPTNLPKENYPEYVEIPVQVMEFPPRHVLM
jgi:hypothetical protein